VPVKDLLVPPERIERWLAGFAERHGAVSYTVKSDVVLASAADGAQAECRVPFPPLDRDETRPDGGLPEHAVRARTVAVVLVRRGGYAAGVFEGTLLVASKVGSRRVQGRTAAGGQSQQRFARRREKQAREAFEAAADVAARVIGPYADRLDAVVLGGDRAAADQVLADRRLRGLAGLVARERLAVPDPKLAVLKDAPRQFRGVRIHLVEPEVATGS
jgi:Actinobacteria/chloroflexi VLRF1 release factor